MFDGDCGRASGVTRVDFHRRQGQAKAAKELDRALEAATTHPSVLPSKGQRSTGNGVFVDLPPKLPSEKDDFGHDRFKS